MMKLQYLGHSCFSVELQGKTLLFDPFITGNSLASEVDVNAIQADYILLSHGHFDHVADAEAIAKRTGAVIVSNYEIVSWFQSKGISNVHPMNHGGTWNFDFGSVKFVNAVHSSVLPDGVYGGNPGGFVISTQEGSFYYSGDTALTLDMKLIPEMGYNLSFCVLPIGNNFTMGIAEAAKAASFVQCRKVIGVHYDTFGYIKIDHDAAKQHFNIAELELLLPSIGETIEL